MLVKTYNKKKSKPSSFPLKIPLNNKSKYTEPNYYNMIKNSSSPNFPHTPPKNSPPDINYLRKIYLNYLSNTNLE